MANNTEQELRDQLDDLKIEAKYESHSGQYYLTSESIDKIMAWHEAEATRREQAARVDENAWSRQQMIAAQAMEAPNSGFGRMVKWAISLLNERKLALLSTAAELKRQAEGEK